MTTRWWASASSSIKCSLPCCWPGYEILCRDLQESPLECMNTELLAAFQHSPSCLLKKKKKKDNGKKPLLCYLPSTHRRPHPFTGLLAGRQPGGARQMEPEEPEASFSLPLQPQPLVLSLLKSESQLPSCLLNPFIPSRVSSQGNMNTLLHLSGGAPKKACTCHLGLISQWSNQVNGLWLGLKEKRIWNRTENITVLTR